MKVPRLLNKKKDFDAWSYSIVWPQVREALPLLGVVSATVEDIKFAYNAWSLLRLTMFFGMESPTILSNLAHTRPSMEATHRANHLFHKHAKINGVFNSGKIKIALTLGSSKAQPIQLFPWGNIIRECNASIQSRGLELVLGMENGMSDEISERCDHHIFIPQYGSIGSLSMLSALSIAIHTAHTAFYGIQKKISPPKFLGNDIASCSAECKNLYQVPRAFRQELNFTKNSLEIIRTTLTQRRKMYSLQIALIMYNDLSDRNIGAVIRNADAFNCERMIILNRRCFDARGAVGTQHTVNLTYYKDVEDLECQNILKQYAVWMLYPYYPYLQMYSDLRPNGINSDSFFEHEDDRLKSWQSTNHYLTKAHPLVQWFPHLVNSEIFLDDECSLFSAIEQIKCRGLRGIMLAVPEEGTSPHPNLARISSATLFIINPNYLNLMIQRGLNPALATSIALERIRFCIDRLN